MKPIIPDAALDDRLGWVGTSGYGKTYNAGTSVERLLGDGARVVIVDPLDVWWGLRLLADGKTPSPHRVVIFGGAHADLPVNEHAGALIGETVAGMAESCIVSLGGLGTKSAERRFMLAFLDTLYRKATGEPFHVIFDEADLWAPQKAIEPMLQNLMEQIVRRGRVKGFIPWLITQRPAVISKDVLSQVDGLIAFRLTSSQDRDALEGWIEGQADRQEWKAIRAQLPTMERGMGVVWIPGRGVLETKAFPAKRTFDSSRTPKRGEKKREAAALAPLDLPALKERLAKVEAETKANDPSKLKAQIAQLRAELAKKPAAAAPAKGKPAGPRAEDLATIKALRKALENAMKFIIEISAKGFDGKVDAEALQKALAGAAQTAASIVERHVDQRNRDFARLRQQGEKVIQGLQALLEGDVTVRLDVRHNEPFSVTTAAPKAPAPRREARVNGEASTVTGAKQRILDALAWLEAVRIDRADKVQLALLADQSPTSSGYANNLGALRSAGLIEYPAGGQVQLTAAGRGQANTPDAPPTTADLHDTLKRRLPGAQWRIVETLIGKYPHALDRGALADLSGQSHRSSGYANNLGALRSLGFIDYPNRGEVIALPVLFLEGR